MSDNARVPTEGMTDGQVESMWLAASNRHEDTRLREQNEKKNWRLMAFYMLFPMMLAIGGVIWMGLQSKFIPLVMEVDKLGHVVAVKALYGDEAATDINRVIYTEMFELFENLRTVSTDRKANNRNLDKAFSRLTGAALTYAKDQIGQAPPNIIGQSKSVEVKVRTAVRQTDKTWLVEWEEQSYALTGEETGDPEYWKATLQYEIRPSTSEEGLRKNSSGFLVPNLNWTKVVR